MCTALVDSVKKFVGRMRMDGIGLMHESVGCQGWQLVKCAMQSEERQAWLVMLGSTA